MPQDIVTTAAQILTKNWNKILARGKSLPLTNAISDTHLIENINSVINSKSKSYRYVLPTQLVAKLANPELDSRCLQVVRGGPGAFDARTIAHKVIVPFDQANDNVLGGSPEPYVNNPLRVPEISAEYRGAQKNADDWDRICKVLNAVETKNDPAFTGKIFEQVLIEIYRRLSEVKVVYPVPRRISLEKSIEIIERFLATQSGGERLLALTAAIFRVIGIKFRLFADVRRTSITTADTAKEMLADLECISKNNEIVLIVEVKDRELTVSQIRSKIPNIRAKQVSEIFFVAQKGVSNSDKQDIAQLIANEFVSGHNIYVFDLVSLSRTVLPLFGESGRREFITEVGSQLDKYHSDILHRRKWAELIGGA